MAKSLDGINRYMADIRLNNNRWLWVIGGTGFNVMERARYRISKRLSGQSQAQLRVIK